MPQKSRLERKSEMTWSTFLPKDRMMDILARFLCAVFLSVYPQKITAIDVAPVGVTHISRTLFPKPN